MERMSISNTDLMREFRAGSHKGFREVFNRYYDLLCHFAYSKVFDTNVAQDIASEAMSLLWNRHRIVETPEEIKDFLYITTRNSCKNYLLPHANRNGQSISVLAGITSERLDENEMNGIIKIELYKKILDKIESLPDKQRSVFKLLFLEDGTIEEVAYRLEMSLASVRSHRASAMSKLRNLFGDWQVSAAVLLFLINLFL